jgi:uncharacterized protein YyaL (SSP411 family)
MRRYPSAFGRALCALDSLLNPPKEIVLIGKSAELWREIWSRYLPHKVVVLAEENETESIELVPLLQNRAKIDGKPTVYVCENFTCQQPVTNRDDLMAHLD